MANTLTFANLTLTDSDIYGGISFLHDLNTGEEFTIGNTASASVKFTTDAQLPLYSKDSVNGTFTWTRDSVSRGRYYITEVTKNGGRYEVTAYDAMVLLDTSISSLSLSLPKTIAQIASAIATYIGCTVSGTVTNGSISISALDADMTCRQLLHYVAEASGCSVKIDGSDHLCFMYYADSGITVSASDYMEGGLDIADYTCAAIDNVSILDEAGVVCATYGSGTNSLFIQGNPFLYSATNTEAQAIYAVVSGFAYAPLRCEMFEENGIEVGTIATFGTTPTLVMHIESGEFGAMVSSVGSDTRAELNKSITVMIGEAMATASSAQSAVQALNQHFWYTSSGNEAGAHIAEVERADFETTPSGGNLLSRSNGIYLREGLDVLASFDATGIRIGQEQATSALKLTAEEISMLTEQGAPFFLIKTTQTSVTSEAVVAGGKSSVYLGYDTATLIGTIANGTDIRVSGVWWSWSFRTTGAAPTLTGYDPSCTVEVDGPDANNNYKIRLIAPDTVFQYGTSDRVDLGNVTLTYTSYYEQQTYTINYAPYIQYNGARSISINESWQSGLILWGELHYDDITAEITDAEAPSFTLGTRAGSDGALSLSSGLSLYASQDYQAAFGMYNENDTGGDYALIVGNGSADNARSNAIATTWDGDILMAVDANAASGTDYDIITALTSLGWDSDVLI